MFKHILGMAAASLSLPGALREPHHMGRTRYPAGHRPARNRYRLPHQGQREIERRKRQAARNEACQIERAANSTFASLHGAEKLSRRGRVVPANAERN